MMDPRFTEAALRALSDDELDRLHHAVLARLRELERLVAKAREAYCGPNWNDDVAVVVLRVKLETIKAKRKKRAERARELRNQLALLRLFEWLRRRRAARDLLAHEEAMRSLQEMFDATVKELSELRDDLSTQAGAAIGAGVLRLNLDSKAAERCVAEISRRKDAGKPPPESQGAQPSPGPDRKPGGGSGQQHRPPSDHADDAGADRVDGDVDDGDGEGIQRPRG